MICYKTTFIGSINSQSIKPFSWQVPAGPNYYPNEILKYLIYIPTASNKLSKYSSKASVPTIGSLALSSVPNAPVKGVFFANQLANVRGLSSVKLLIPVTKKT